MLDYAAARRWTKKNKHEWSFWLYVNLSPDYSSHDNSSPDNLTPDNLLPDNSSLKNCPTTIGPMTIGPLTTCALTSHPLTIHSLRMCPLATCPLPTCSWQLIPWRLVPWKKVPRQLIPWQFVLWQLVTQLQMFNSNGARGLTPVKVYCSSWKGYNQGPESITMFVERDVLTSNWHNGPFSIPFFHFYLRDFLLLFCRIRSKNAS